MLVIFDNCPLAPPRRSSNLGVEGEDAMQDLPRRRFRVLSRTRVVLLLMAIAAFFVHAFLPPDHQTSRQQTAEPLILTNPGLHSPRYFPAGCGWPHSNRILEHRRMFRRNAEHPGRPAAGVIGPLSRMLDCYCRILYLRSYGASLSRRWFSRVVHSWRLAPTK
jgi:hypothetical protein